MVRLYFLWFPYSQQHATLRQDVDKDGEVEYTEFIAATLEARGNIEEERIAEAFDRLDTDQSGFISKRELAQFLGTTATSKEVDDILEEADTNNDGQCKYKASVVQTLCKLFRSIGTNFLQPHSTVSYSEFVEIFRKRRSEMRASVLVAANLDYDYSNRTASQTSLPEAAS